MLNQRSDKVELLRIAEAVAIEKSIDKEIILNSMETAIQKAAKISKKGQEKPSTQKAIKKLTHQTDAENPRYPKARKSTKRTENWKVKEQQFCQNYA